jgi:hypothetical protein
LLRSAVVRAHNGYVGISMLRKPQVLLRRRGGESATADKHRAMDNAPPTVKFVQRFVRPRLPPFLRYGIGWNCFLTVCYMGVASVSFYMWTCIFRTEEEKTKIRDEYVLVKDAHGRPVDYAYRPLVEASQRAKERNRRLREGDV